LLSELRNIVWLGWWFGRLVLRRRLAILKGLLARQAEGFEEVDSFFTLQLELTDAVHQGFLSLGAWCEVGDDSVGVVVVDLLERLSPASHSLAFVSLHIASQLLCFRW
jgi:hypothetical protein